MAGKRNRNMVEFKSELKTLLKSIRKAQSDLARLRAIGADEASIRRVMALMGFGGVSPDEFLAVSTGEDVAKLVSKVSRARRN